MKTIVTLAVIAIAAVAVYEAWPYLKARMPMPKAA